jgi:uncharacterized membrane protein YkvA (DUF1232 family)
VGIKDLLDQILNSVFYTKSVSKASKMSGNATGILNLLKNVLEKVNKEGTSSLLNTVSKKILLLANLIKCYASGEYRDIETKNLVLILAALIYLVSPIDFIPDFIPVLGFADDIALLTFVYNAMSEEIDKFELWALNKDLNK